MNYPPLSLNYRLFTMLWHHMNATYYCKSTTRDDITAHTHRPQRGNVWIHLYLTRMKSNSCTFCFLRECVYLLCIYYNSVVRKERSWLPRLELHLVSISLGNIINQSARRLRPVHSSRVPAVSRLLKAFLVFAVLVLSLWCVVLCFHHIPQSLTALFTVMSCKWDV